ncbi:MAG: SRPBCC family protein [Actinomycetota bacterium]
MEVRYTESGTVDAPPEAAYDLRADFTRLADYNPNVTNLRRTDGGDALGAGAVYAFDVTIADMGGTVSSVLTVLEAEHPSRVATRTDSGVFSALEEVRFEPEGGGTRVTFDVIVELPDDMEAIAPIVDSSGREQVRLELDHMAKVLVS